MSTGEIQLEGIMHDWLLSVLTNEPVHTADAPRFGSSRNLSAGSYHDHGALTMSTHEAPVAAADNGQGAPAPVRALQALRSIELRFEHFDSDLLDADADGHALQVLFPELLARSGLLDGVARTEGEPLQIDGSRLLSFLGELDEAYGDNPYHNRCHACDVLVGTYCFLQNNGSPTPLQRFAALFAAAIHDFAHRGTTNAFEMRSDSELAIRYSDESVLEAYHLSSAFALLKRSNNNFLAAWPREEYVEFRRFIIRLVLMISVTP